MGAKTKKSEICKTAACAAVGPQYVKFYGMLKRRAARMAARRFCLFSMCRFQRQQLPFDSQPAGVPAKPAACVDNPVAGDHNGQWVVVVGLPHGPRAARAAHCGRKLGIALGA